MEWFYQAQPPVQAAVVAAAVALITTFLAAPLRYLVDNQVLRYKLKTEYEYEQRKRLQDLIGTYVGRMLESSENVSRRMWNFYSNESKGWLRVDGKFDDLKRQYYFTSSVHRFLSMYVTIRRFELEAIYIDSRISDRDALTFLKFLKAMQWVMTDSDLFRGLIYDTFRSKDHLFSDDLRRACDRCWKDEKILSFEDITKDPDSMRSINSVLALFDDLRSGENRYRWDRFVALHLLIMAFLNAFGYDIQRSSDERFLEAAGRMQHHEVLANLVASFPHLGLSDHREMKRIAHAATLLRPRLGAQAATPLSG